MDKFASPIPRRKLVCAALATAVIGALSLAALGQTSTTQPTDSPPVTDTFTKRALDYVNLSKPDRAERARILSDAAGIDRGIAEYGKKNNLSDDAIASMYRGELTVGMTEDAVKVIAAMIKTKYRTTTVRGCDVTVWQPGPDPQPILVTIADGKITAILNNAG